jgi:hypothetical protein
MAVAMFMAHSASAIKIVVPDQYKDQVEAIKKAERTEREQELEGVAESAEGSIQIAGEDKPERETPAVDADEFLVQSVIEATDTAAAIGDSLAADEGIVSGQVVDKETGEPVSGAAILIEGTDIATVTDDSGRYSLGPAPAGIYTLSFIKTGYIEANITEYTVAGGEVSVFPFALPPRPADMSDEVYELQDFTVTAEQATQMMLEIDLRQNSLATLDILNSEDFAKFAVSDVAEAVTRISGASLSDGKYVVVRGLNDRYNTVLINGAVLPSPDPDRKAVALDIFPTSLIGSIVARKSYTSDMPGESSGGSIELKTKGIPEEPFINFSTSFGGQVTSDETKEFLADPEQIGLSDWLQGEDYRGYGVADGDFTLLSDYPNKVGDRNFPFMSPRSTNMSPFGDRSYSLSMGGSRTVNEWLEIGAIFGVKVSEKRRSSYKEIQKVTFDDGFAVIDQTTDQKFLADQGFTFENQLGELKGTEEYSAAALFGLGAKVGDHTNLNYNYIYSDTLASTATRSRYAEFDSGSESTTSGQQIPVGFNQILDTEVGSENRLLQAHQFNGEHTFAAALPDDWTFSWYYTMAHMEQEEADQRQISGFYEELGGFKGIAQLAPISRFQRETEQDSDVYGMSLEQSIDIGDFATFSINLGFDAEESSRSFLQLETVGGNPSGELNLSAMPSPDGLSALFSDVFVDDFTDLDPAIRDFYDRNVLVTLPGNVSTLQGQLASREATLASNQASIPGLEDSLASSASLWNSIPTLGGGGFTFDTDTGQIFDPSLGQFVDPATFDGTSNQAVFDAYEFALQGPYNGLEAGEQAVETAQNQVSSTQAALNSETAELALVSSERDDYFAAANAFLGQIASMPALATDPTAFPTFNFNGDDNYILQTPAGFSVYADQSAESAPAFDNVPFLYNAVGENKVKSFYMSGDIKFDKVEPVKSIRLAGGFRREETQLSYVLRPDRVGDNQPVASSAAVQGFAPIVVSPSNIDQTDLAYYASLIVDINDHLKFSFSRSTTIAKPTFREIAPFPILNLTDRSIEIGNGGLTVTNGNSPDPIYILPPEFAGLQIAEVESMDFRLEAYTPLDGLVSIGYFTKTIGQPIERILALQVNGVDVSTFINNDNDAELEGFEFELQQNLGVLNDVFGDTLLPFEWITIGGNYTLLDAIVNRSAFEQSNLTSGKFNNNLSDPGVFQDGGRYEERPLYDQPEYVANAFISLDIEPTGTRITLSQNWLGKQLERAGGISGSREGSADLYWDDFTSMNLVIEQELSEYWKLQFSVKNLDSPVRKLYEDDIFYSALIDDTLYNEAGGDALSGGAAQSFRTRQKIEPTYSISISGRF